jgi:sec-independent protein translocase protein TatA
MSDEQVIKLLEEIRDLQKEQLANYKHAIENQHQAIEVQKQAVERQKSAVRTVRLAVFAIVLVLFGGSKLPDLAKSLGKSMKEFKKGIATEPEEEAPKPQPAASASPAPPPARQCASCKGAPSVSRKAPLVQLI